MVHMDATEVLRDLAEVESKEDLGRFNDSHTHAEVLALVDDAIAAEEARL